MTDHIRHCPHCAGELHHHVVAEIPDSQRVGFKVCPTPNGRLAAKTVGGMLTNFAELMETMMKDAGVEQTAVMMDSIIMHDDGSVEVGVIVARSRVVEVADEANLLDPDGAHEDDRAEVLERIAELEETNG